jgi:mannose-6-phosphate isomerase
MFHTAFDAVNREPHSPFSLYENAFYLFALAQLRATHADRYPIAATAQRTLERLRQRLGKRIGGFEESDPPSLPLKSNPHMHLLEAALAWMRMADGAAQAPWIALGRELVGLCLTQFRDASTGAIREYFGYGWQPAAGDDGRILEPGHQFEWAWLLLQWADTPQCTEAERAACRRAAEQLIELGERWGVDAVRGIAINELWDDMTVKDAAAKLWPQAERLKAWCALLERSQTRAEAERASGRIAAAAQGMMSYLRTDAPGLWHETCAADGSFAAGPSRASSFYHIVGALEGLRRSVSSRSGGTR